MTADTGAAETWSVAGKTIVITGANSGIGREAAAELARRGALVVLTSRDATKGEDALSYVRSESGNDDAVLMSLDLASFDSIRAFASDFLDRFDRLHVLINNAGALLSYRLVTSEGYEMTFGVNHLGHFLLTDLLVGLMKDSAPARIVNVSSLAHRFAGGLNISNLQHEADYRGVAAYNESKLANVLFTKELARRLEGTGVTANACHPGPVRTGFGGADDTTGVQRLGMAIAKPFLIGPRRGSVPLVYLASSPDVSGISGAYFSRRPLSGLPGVRVRPHRAASAGRDEAAARELWEASERLIAGATR